METFGKAWLKACGTSATVARMGRHALLPAALALLAVGGLASSLLAAPPPPGVGTTTTTATVATTTVTTSPAASVVVVSGHGWGHGLGLSQWGAYGYAKHGWLFDRILAHYYSGTSLGPAKVSTVRVLLASAKKVTIASLVPWTVVDGTGTKTTLDPGPLVLKPALAVTGHPELRPPLTFTAKQPLTVNGTAYRGRMGVSSDGKLVQVIDTLGLEAYLKGVVPAEMPSSWPPEALKAQAVAARSYALANLTTGRPFDLYGDTRSQVFGGVKVENTATSVAVDSTKGQVVLYNGKVADTLFFSTSGGRTASALESTGLSVPYLVPVSDPYDTASPYHDWGPVLFDAAAVAEDLKLASPIADLQTTTGPSGRVRSLTLVSDDDAQVTVTGNQVRGALELRSTWFTPAFLQLLPKAKTMTYGGALSLTGKARGVDEVSLEAKPYGLDWAPVGDLLLDADGAFSTIIRPQVATQYRLVWGDVRAGLAKIAVAERIDATIQAGTVTGTTTPAVANAAVQVQWSEDGLTGWQTVASATTDTSGAFSVQAQTTPGSYRARVAPGRGLAPGLSKTSTCC